MPKVVIRLEKPIDPNFLDQQSCNVIREDEFSVYLSVGSRNRYKGDDESIVLDLGNGVLKNYDGNYSIVWEESEY